MGYSTYPKFRLFGQDRIQECTSTCDKTTRISTRTLNPDGAVQDTLRGSYNIHKTFDAKRFQKTNCKSLRDKPGGTSTSGSHHGCHMIMGTGTAATTTRTRWIKRVQLQRVRDLQNQADEQCFEFAMAQAMTQAQPSKLSGPMRATAAQVQKRPSHAPYAHSFPGSVMSEDDNKHSDSSLILHCMIR